MNVKKGTPCNNADNCPDCSSNWTDREFIIFERGFEEGYATAKRIYRPTSVQVLNENNEVIKLRNNAR